jgi:hypothetical protein
MIILEDTPESPSKLRQEQLSPSSDSLQANPPAYPGHSFPNPGPQFQSQPYSNFDPTPISPLNGDYTSIAPRQNAKKRFTHAFWSAVAVYVLAGAFIHSLILLVNTSKHKVGQSCSLRLTDSNCLSV